MTGSKFCEHGVNVGLENPTVFCGQCPPDTITKLRADLASVRLDYANECDRARRAEARHERDKDELRADLARVTKERDEARAEVAAVRERVEWKRREADWQTAADLADRDAAIVRAVRRRKWLREPAVVQSIYASLASADVLPDVAILVHALATMMGEQ